MRASVKATRLNKAGMPYDRCPLCYGFLTPAYRRRPEDYVLLPGFRRITYPLVALRCWRCRYFEVRPKR